LLASYAKQNNMKLKQISIEETFADDDEKMKDFFLIPKSSFLFSYSYLTENEYDITKDYVLQQINKLTKE
jgi:hypothetical protein